MRKLNIGLLACGLLAAALVIHWQQGEAGAMVEESTDTNESAYLAGGCFWCVEADFEKVEGVVEVISGYMGGKKTNPTYEQVSSGTTGHVEAIRVVYDPAVVSYAEILDNFWRFVDPTDPGGQFVDRGPQYRTVIFFDGEDQRKTAEQSKSKMVASGVFAKPLATEILPFSPFYPAEDYHQDYYKKNPIRYSFYRFNSGRDRFLNKTWKDKEIPVTETPKPGGGKFVKPAQPELRSRLTPLQYKVTQEEGTEPAFRNQYWENKEPGIYVDIVSGEPLFSSKEKFDSGTGWPSFFSPLEPDNIVEERDFRLFFPRTEVRSRQGDSHLGHVFSDGPAPTGLRYCINSAALRFIPAERLEEEGYAEYLPLFEKDVPAKSK